MKPIDVTQNYFAAFELPVQFALDSDQLEQSYQQLQRENHPDRFSRADEESQRLAMQVASYLNSAYSVLRKPLQRAVYMLELSGVDLQEQSRSMPVEFLTEQIELREKLEDAAGNHDALSAFESELTSAMQTLFAELAGEMRVPVSEHAIGIIQKLQFFHKLHQQTEDMLFELG